MKMRVPGVSVNAGPVTSRTVPSLRVGRVSESLIRPPYRWVSLCRGHHASVNRYMMTGKPSMALIFPQSVGAGRLTGSPPGEVARLDCAAGLSSSHCSSASSSDFSGARGSVSESVIRFHTRVHIGSGSGMSGPGRGFPGVGSSGNVMRLLAWLWN